MMNTVSWLTGMVVVVVVVLSGSSNPFLLAPLILPTAPKNNFKLKVLAPHVLLCTQNSSEREEGEEHRHCL